MKTLSRTVLTLFVLSFSCLAAIAGEVSFKITKQYLNFPISHKENRGRMTFEVNGKPDLSVVIRLAPDEAEYWVFKDVSAFKGKTIKITYDGNEKGLSKIYQSDEIEGQAELYKEKNRPQFHFTTRRGWINDPNGLIYYEGESHLFYQHNPFERDWENMHWGHAVSKDLIHWTELPDALYPDHLGTMFSGSAVIDYDNTAGFNKGKTPAMVVAFTAASSDRQVQGIAYSLDKGRTFTKYDKNPVINSKEKWNSQDTRDPKVFWYAPSKHWVLVLNERDGHSIYTSSNLKDWKYESHVTGFWECPELFELPVDGDKNHTKWVMYRCHRYVYARLFRRQGIYSRSRKILLYHRKYLCSPDLYQYSGKRRQTHPDRLGKNLPPRYAFQRNDDAPHRTDFAYHQRRHPPCQRSRKGGRIFV